MSRQSWDEYWLGMLEKVASRATCDRGRSGAILVDGEQQIISTGYVGAARGLPHCDEVGHLLRKVIYEDGTTHEHCKRTGHAERNAISQAARKGTATKGSTLYCTMEPCIDCANDIINAGIVRVVALHRYHGAKQTREWFAQVGIALKVMSDDQIKYEPEVKLEPKKVEPDEESGPLAPGLR